MNAIPATMSTGRDLDSSESSRQYAYDILPVYPAYHSHENLNSRSVPRAEKDRRLREPDGLIGLSNSNVNRVDRPEERAGASSHHASQLVTGKRKAMSPPPRAPSFKRKRSSLEAPLLLSQPLRPRQSSEEPEEREFNSQARHRTRSESGSDEFALSLPPIRLLTKINRTIPLPSTSTYFSSNGTYFSSDEEIPNLSGLISYANSDTSLVAWGGYSDIHKATLGSKPVAVKVIRDVHIAKRNRRSLLRNIKKEMCLWARMEHSNVLPFLGYCFFPTHTLAQDGDGSPFSLVSPWMKNGTVISYIKENPLVDRTVLLMDVFKGLRFLHSQGVVHGDLKGSNVLVSEDGVAVLADFGLASLADADPSLSRSHHASTTGIKGTVNWMAPELLDACEDSNATTKPTTASDVWALGCLILEVIASKIPYQYCKKPANVIREMIRSKPPFIFTPTPQASQTESWVSDTYVPLEFHGYPDLWFLCEDCWDFEPTRRPDCISMELVFQDEMLLAESKRYPYCRESCCRA
ncbi:kinase-like protein [Sistotremastrum suecicum HHB10207 ss-3]|uniref:Kinase-like protein n=1 Tax=Sistotremastrum suecicum HHB10207 ss-3 TaxID=1314776 RepID=A0A166FLJ2_9AGAM|nr:kinase-like protein [Sistotremastrum suecicum HHB10207 ss-3]